MTKFKYACYFPCDGQVFLLKLVEMLSGNTYFRWISMNCWPFALFFSLKVNFRRWKCSLIGNTLYLRLFEMKGFDAIRSGHNCFISMIISVDTLCGFAPLVIVPCIGLLQVYITSLYMVLKKAIPMTPSKDWVPLNKHRWNITKIVDNHWLLHWVLHSTHPEVDDIPEGRIVVSFTKGVGRGTPPTHPFLEEVYIFLPKVIEVGQKLSCHF